MSLRGNKHQALAKDALVEFSDGSFGKFISEKEVQKGIFDVSFESTKRGYEGWQWVVTVTQPDKRKPPTISEVTLIAGPKALLAPAWVPWSERLKEFREQLRKEGKAKTDAEADALISQMSGAHGEETDGTKKRSNAGSVEPPKKTRVRKRLIKRSEDNQDNQPQASTDSED
ncbi:MAG: hypothetical protein RIR89_793 [Actinomycetota bacterium]